MKQVQVKRHKELMRTLGLDPIPPRTPLHARITGTLQQDGYAESEKVVFESRPRFYVTAHVYVPEPANRAQQEKFPVIVNVNGHWAHKKDEDRVQLRCAFQALRGAFSPSPSIALASASRRQQPHRAASGRRPQRLGARRRRHERDRLLRLGHDKGARLHRDPTRHRHGPRRSHRSFRRRLGNTLPPSPRTAGTKPQSRSCTCRACSKRRTTAASATTSLVRLR